MAFKYVPGASLNSDNNAFFQESTCYQTVLRFHICLKKTFSYSICHGFIEYQNESAAVLILAVFVNHQDVDS